MKNADISNIRTLCQSASEKPHRVWFQLIVKKGLYETSAGKIKFARHFQMKTL
jgi:hypothetical protein